MLTLIVFVLDYHWFGCFAQWLPENGCRCSVPASWWSCCSTAAKNYSNLQILSQRFWLEFKSLYIYFLVIMVIVQSFSYNRILIRCFCLHTKSKANSAFTNFLHITSSSQDRILSTIQWGCLWGKPPCIAVSFLLFPARFKILFFLAGAVQWQIVLCEWASGDSWLRCPQCDKAADGVSGAW